MIYHVIKRKYAVSSKWLMVLFLCNQSNLSRNRAISFTCPKWKGTMAWIMHLSPCYLQIIKFNLSGLSVDIIENYLNHTI